MWVIETRCAARFDQTFGFVVPEYTGTNVQMTSCLLNSHRNLLSTVAQPLLSNVNVKCGLHGFDQGLAGHFTVSDPEFRYRRSVQLAPVA
ncbi:hypothetical protein ACVIGB_005269 [Bradyrhizobium sp. USDA 4341]